MSWYSISRERNLCLLTVGQFGYSSFCSSAVCATSSWVHLKSILPVCDHWQASSGNLLSLTKFCLRTCLNFHPDQPPAYPTSSAWSGTRTRVSNRVGCRWDIAPPLTRDPMRTGCSRTSHEISLRAWDIADPFVHGISLRAWDQNLTDNQEY